MQDLILGCEIVGMVAVFVWDVPWAGRDVDLLAIQAFAFLSLIYILAISYHQSQASRTVLQYPLLCREGAPGLRGSGTPASCQ